MGDTLTLSLQWASSLRESNIRGLSARCASRLPIQAKPVSRGGTTGRVQALEDTQQLQKGQQNLFLWACLIINCRALKKILNTQNKNIEHSLPSHSTLFPERSTSLPQTPASQTPKQGPDGMERSGS